ncbi:MAG: hypothetical protein BWY68_00395 [bacterium ADurb.Bin400]|nr:MAG: hypothetical protein BWY68_00395 [bacterium ADurb.Bin400]
MAFAALNIIRLCQSLSGEEWQHFSHQQISKRLKHWSLNTTMGFKRLVKEDFVVQGQDGFFRLTEDLIMKCYLTAPANLQVDEPADEHYCA